MPTLRIPVSGSRVMTCGSVMNGPPSWGQVVSTGIEARSGSRSTISCTGPEETCFGGSEASLPSFGIILSLSQSPCGGAILSSARSSLAGSSRSSQESAQAARRRVPKRFIATGMTPEEGFSKRSAGPPCLAARSASAAMSSRRSTGSETRVSSPARANLSRNSRRDL